MAKVKIQGHASGTGILTVTAPNTSSDRTITLPDATGTLLNSDGSGAALTGFTDSQMPAGSVIQVLHASHTGSSNSSSTSYVATGLTLDITPASTSNKILILTSYHIEIAGSSQAQDGYYQLLRDATSLVSGQASSSYDQGGDGAQVGAIHSMNYLDSPSSTSALTYKVQMKMGTNGGSETRWDNGFMTLLEIAG